jgi:riboflavin kinase/FMN adenylyltransferase
MRSTARWCTAIIAAGPSVFRLRTFVPENELLPPNGVYATTARLGAFVLPSVTNIGTRPTVDQTGKTHIETHVFNLDKDLYGSSLRIGFVQRLRDERTFESLDALRAQIEADCQRARVLFDRLSL